MANLINHLSSHLLSLVGYNTIFFMLLMQPFLGLSLLQILESSHPLHRKTLNN